MDSVAKEVKADRVETRRKDGGALVDDDDGLVDYVRGSGDDDSKLVASSGSSHRDRGDDDLHSYSTSSEECVPAHIQQLYHTTKITRTTSGISEKDNASISPSLTSLNLEEKLEEDKANFRLVDYVRGSGDDDSKLVASSGSSHRDRGDDDLHSYSTSSEECVPAHIQQLYHTTKITRTTSGISEQVNAPISSSLTSLNLEEKLEEEWNPMKRDCDTAQNVISSDIDKSAGAFFMGVKHKEKSWAETPCPFYKGEGNYCWKGPRCRMLHKVVDASDLGQERVASSYTLDNKPHLQPGIWVDVKVVYIVSPSEFYVIPRNATECICRAAFPPAASKTPPMNPMQHDGLMQHVSDTMAEEFGTGVKAFEKIKAKLNELLEPNMAWRQRQSTHYALTELVAVKRTEKRECDLGSEVPFWNRTLLMLPTVKFHTTKFN